MRLHLERLILGLALACLPLAYAGCASAQQPVEEMQISEAFSASEDSEVSEVSEVSDTSDSDFSLEDFDEYGEFETEGQTLADPLKPWNKAWFYFNDKLYFWLIKPVSIGYGYVLPRPLRKGVQNVFVNLAFPVRFVNNSFQGKFKRSGMELSRFLVNSTVGVLGLWDPSTRLFHWKRYPEDFDQTLGVWRIGQGCYLTWPLLGPSSIRGTFGAAADLVLNPASYLPGAGVLVRINDRSLGQTEYETLVENAVDPYTSVRNAYVQNREKVVSE